jgi:hypothetical protein
MKILKRRYRNNSTLIMVAVLIAVTPTTTAVANILSLYFAIPNIIDQTN